MNSSFFRIKQHVANPENPPILIFPEGTCSSNTSIMQFKKGVFEDAKVVHPIAIKYDMRFANAFWDTTRVPIMKHIFLVMTSWGIVCDIWYLPAMEKEENESAVDFANRVKSAIANKIGLKQSIWDGQLKRKHVKEEWIANQKEKATQKLF